jgi:WD repeat-containing protein 35
LLRSLKIPGTNISGLSWEYNGLRISFAVDSFVYFANVRQDYLWSFFAKDTIAYTFQKSESCDKSLVFWNLKTTDVYSRNVTEIVAMASGDNHLIVAQKTQQVPLEYEYPN